MKPCGCSHGAGAVKAAAGGMSASLRSQGGAHEGGGTHIFVVGLEIQAVRLTVSVAQLPYKIKQVFAAWSACINPLSAYQTDN